MDVEPLVLKFFSRNAWSSFQCRHSLDQALAFRDGYDLMLNRGDELEIADEGRFVRSKFVDEISRECALHGRKVIEPKFGNAVEVPCPPGVADAALLTINDVVLVIPPQAGKLRGQRAVSVSPVRLKFGGFQLRLFLQQTHSHDHPKPPP